MKFPKITWKNMNRKKFKLGKIQIGIKENWKNWTFGKVIFGKKENKENWKFRKWEKEKNV